MNCMRVFATSLLMIGVIACRPQSSNVASLSDGTASSYRLEYRVISNKGQEFEAELRIYPRLEKNWQLGFDYPYQIREVKGGQLRRSNQRYIVTNIESRGMTSSNSSVLRIQAAGTDGGINPPSNATYTVPLRVNATNSSQSAQTPPQSAPSQQSQEVPEQAPPNNTQQKPVGPSICITQDYGLGSKPVAGSKKSYPTSGDLASLPPLSVNATASELKVYVAKLYDQFPTFKEIYERDLGLTREQTLSFLYGDMSRESATNHPVTGKLTWYIELETAITPPGNSAHAWGPFQAAVTNFIGGGFDKEILNKTGLPTPNMSDFRDPAISTFAGMKRLAEGIIAATEHFGPNKPASLYLLGTLAHHNTGWANSAEQQVWREGYGNEVLRLAQAYRFGSNMTNDVVFYTGQPESEICR